MEHEDILRRVAKLLKLATSTNPNEAANAAAQAQRLMDEHRLSTDDVRGASDADPMEQADVDMGGRKVRSVWRGRLAYSVGQHNGCVVFWVGARLQAVGRRSDVRVALYLYDYLAGEIDRLATRASIGRGRAYANAFRNGAVGIIAQRLADDRASQATGAASSALVLRRDTAARAWLTEHHGKLRPARKVSLGSDADGFADGRAAARDIPLKPGVEAGTVAPKAARLHGGA